MRPSRHLALSCAAGGALWVTTGEPLALPIAVGAGVLIDVDHGPDLWWALALQRKPTATFVFHAWEWLAGILTFGLTGAFSWWLSAIIVGYGLHLVSDQAVNKGRIWSYSILYRGVHRFQTTSLAPQWDFHSTYNVLRKELPPVARLTERWRRRSYRSDRAPDVDKRRWLRPKK